MTRKCRAIYEEGVFRPLEPIVGLPEHRAVELVVRESPSRKSFLSLAGRLSAKEADRMTALIEQEFEQIDPREW